MTFKSLVCICGGLLLITALCNSQDQCPTAHPPIEVSALLSGHHLHLTSINQSVNATCERTCGNYRESWLILLYRTDQNIMHSPELLRNDKKVELLKQTHPELSVRLHHAPDSGCTDDMVPFSLELTLIDDNISTTQGNIIITCSAATNSTKVYASLSIVVYLPVQNNTTSDPPSTSVTPDPTKATATPDPTTVTPDPTTATPDPQCPVIDARTGRVIVTWPNLAIFAALLVAGVLIGVLCGCAGHRLMCRKSPKMDNT